jgi:hypothetical protein
VARLLDVLHNARMGHSQSPFFFYISMRVVDFLACGLLVFSFLVRLVTSLVVTDGVRLLHWTLGTQDALAFATMLLVFAFLQVISYNRSLGQALTTLFEMIHGSLDVLFIILVISAGFGVASAPLLPSLFRFEMNTTATAERAAAGGSAVPTIDTNNVFLMPIFLGAYVLLGLLDIGLYDELAGFTENEVSMAALCLLLFSLFVTVFCMNLLIAKMASRYETINKVASSYRRFQHIALIKRYKDEGPPCPFNLFVDLYKLLTALLRFLARWVVPRRLLCGHLRPSASEAAPEIVSRFTVYSGAVATRRSAETERTYMRNFVREEEAKIARGAHGEGAAARDTAIAAGIASLRHAFGSRLDKLEAATLRARSFSSYGGFAGDFSGGGGSGASSYRGGGYATAGGGTRHLARGASASHMASMAAVQRSLSAASLGSVSQASALPPGGGDGAAAAIGVGGAGPSREELLATLHNALDALSHLTNASEPESNREDPSIREHHDANVI